MVLDTGTLRGRKLKMIDISQPISTTSAVFPGDVPFSRNVTVTFEESNVINLTALTMSPHVGTHADSPVHVRGSMSDAHGMAGELPLEPFIGPVSVIDLAPFDGPIGANDADAKLPRDLCERVLFRTCNSIRYDVWEKKYAHLTPGLIEYLAVLGVKLIGIDTPSVDHVEAKELESHNQLLKREMLWLENLDLTKVKAGNYFLIALPLKFMELEASPVRAILLDQSDVG